MLVKGGNKSSQAGHQLNYQNVINYYQLEMGNIEFPSIDYFLTKNHDYHYYCQCICLRLCVLYACTISSNKQYMKFKNMFVKFGWGFHAISTFIWRNIHIYCDFWLFENQKNGDDTIIASQVIMMVSRSIE